MRQIEWMETWVRIKKRYPKWQPTDVETEDWCRALHVYTKDAVEEVTRWVRQNYTSQIPSIKWFIVELEKQKRKERQDKRESQNVQVDERGEHKKLSEETIERLENTDIEILRSACKSVLDKYGNLITKPENGNPRDWKNTFRSLIHQEIYGEK